jgi:hypothetical protein
MILGISAGTFSLCWETHFRCFLFQIGIFVLTLLGHCRRTEELGFSAGVVSLHRLVRLPTHQTWNFELTACVQVSPSYQSKEKPVAYVSESSD